MEWDTKELLKSGEKKNTNKDIMDKEIRLGNLFGATGGNHAGMVYDKNGLSPTLNAMCGGYRQPMIIEVRKVNGGNKNESN